eukprot:TRINITY_DN2209_c0_g1_i2.p1 TRINITY_DN2209_c0_g1~~TRINITY_DN2209_c0_g1_i2.p1  ORF type:complete len:259 (+),score=40.25 TRINITY_DN2209_c0_g1_i2:137-913(+)
MIGSNNEQVVIYIPGLTDGLLAQGFLPFLAKQLNPEGISLIQFIMSSSYGQYGTCSLSTDVEDIDKLISFLIERKKVKLIGLIGHSTGCQDIVTYLKEGKHANKICCAILQGPVSDREYMGMYPMTDTINKQAENLVKAGNGWHFMHPKMYSVPITASRYYSLTGKMTPEDMFSSDIPEPTLKQIFSHIKIPTLWVFSENDECVPATIKAADLVKRIQNNVSGCQVILLPQETHQIKDPALFVQKSTSFITSEFFGSY